MSGTKTTLAAGQTWTPKSGSRAKPRCIVRLGRLSWSSGTWVFYRTDKPIEWSARGKEFHDWIQKHGAECQEQTP